MLLISIINGFHQTQSLFKKDCQLVLSNKFILNLKNKEVLKSLESVNYCIKEKVVKLSNDQIIPALICYNLMCFKYFNFSNEAKGDLYF